MTVILDALAILEQSLEKLESAAVAQEQKALQMQQQELFAASSAANGHTNGNGHHIAIDPAILAQKLDVTIERIEQVLREG